MATQILKTINPFFNDVWLFKKGFEIRKNDRNFSLDDLIILREYFPKDNKFGNRDIIFTPGYVLDSTQFEGLAEDFVCIGITEQINIGNGKLIKSIESKACRKVLYDLCVYLESNQIEVNLKDFYNQMFEKY